MRKLAASWDLLKTSFAILRSDKELILLPITSAILSAIAFVTMMGGWLFANWAAVRAGQHAVGQYGGRTAMPHADTFYLALFLFYIVNYFIVIFLNVALVGVANSRLSGGTWTISDGLSLAAARAFTIFKWAVFAATVGIILRWISERVGLLGKIVVWVVGLTWSLATYFVVPILAFEDLGPIDAVKRSSKLFKDTWGERVVAGLSFGLIFGLAIVAGFGLWFFGMMAFSRSLAVIIFLSLLLLAYIQIVVAISSATASIFNVALYRYALTGKLHGGFTQEQLQSAWVPKG